MKLSTKIILGGAAVAVGWYLWKRSAGAGAAVPAAPKGGTGSGAGSIGSRIRAQTGATSSVGIP